MAKERVKIFEFGAHGLSANDVEQEVNDWLGHLAVNTEITGRFQSTLSEAKESTLIITIFYRNPEEKA